MHIIGDLFILMGSLFIFLGALGLIRMPDVYNRIQVGTKSVTLGAIGVIFGVFLIHPLWWSKLLVVLGFILLTSPVSSSAITRAFYRGGITLWKKSNTKTTTKPNKENPS
jgi:multicomponent Na+:H+ antiporter subunit G